MTVLLDVNVIVSAVLAPLGTVRKILTCWESKRFEVIISEGIVAEVEEKLGDPKIGGHYNIKEDEIIAVRNLLITQARFVTVSQKDILLVTGDPEDDYVLATGKLGKHEFLVTGDKRLLSMKNYADVKIVSPKSFLSLLG